jgi:hypothetical protein
MKQKQPPAPPGHSNPKDFIGRRFRSKRSGRVLTVTGTAGLGPLSALSCRYEEEGRARTLNMRDLLEGYEPA